MCKIPLKHPRPPKYCEVCLLGSSQVTTDIQVNIYGEEDISNRKLKERSRFHIVIHLGFAIQAVDKQSPSMYVVIIL